MFVVIEGIDGAGCETQAKRLVEMLKADNRGVFFVKYPDYERNIGKMIREFLYQNKKLSASGQFLLYSLQFILDKEWIRKQRKNGILIADRYFTSTLCFQTLEGIEIKKALRFAHDFEIEKPDLVFYLNVRPEIAIKRKSGEQKEKNRREKDFQFIEKTYKQYEKLVKEQVWTRWVEIDGEREVDEITRNIFDRIKL